MYIYLLIYFKNTLINIFRNTICQTDEDCPEYSWGCYFDQEMLLGVCDINIFCNNENGCVALKKTYKSSNNNSNMIFQSYRNSFGLELHYDCKEDSDCFEGNCINKKCLAEINHKCTNNEDCFSGICENGICLVNPKDPIKNCRAIVDYNEDGRPENKLVCGNDSNQSCSNDDECISERCKNNICISLKPSNKGINYFIFLYIFGIFEFSKLLILYINRKYFKSTTLFI